MGRTATCARRTGSCRGPAMSASTAVRWKFHIRDDKVVGITGNDEDSIFQGRICPKSQMTLQLYNNERRLIRPLKRVGPKGSGRLEPIAWAQALDEIAAKLVELARPARTGDAGPVLGGPVPESSPTTATCACSSRCGGHPTRKAPSRSAPPPRTWPSGWCRATARCPTATRPTDIGSAGLFVYFGDNQAETRPVYFGMISEWRRRTGARMVVIDPRLSGTANAADRWLPIRSGTDMALVLAMINHIFAEGTARPAFLRELDGRLGSAGATISTRRDTRPPGPLRSRTCRRRRSKLSPKRSPRPTAA